MHVLGYLALKIAISVLKCWLPFIDALENLDESANAFLV
jgi:hypothetical protein